MEKKWKDVEALDFPDYAFKWQEKLNLRGMRVDFLTCGGSWVLGCTRMKNHGGRCSIGNGETIREVEA